MPGAYTHTNILNGANLNSAVYNTDHQNHITNRIPAKIDDYSLDVSQMITVVDPGEVGTENVPLSLADELARLRFVLKEMKGSSFWNATTATHEVSLFAQGTASTLPTQMLPTTTTTFLMFWRVPESYISGDLTYLVCARPITPEGTSRNAALRLSVTRCRAGTAATVIVNDANIDFVGTNNVNVFTKSVTVNASDFTNGDSLVTRFFRLGDDTSDNMNSIITYCGMTVSFTGYGGRF